MFFQHMCYLSVSTNAKNYRQHFVRHCGPKSWCEANNYIANDCAGQDPLNCVLCDNDGELNPAPPKRDVSICGTPSKKIVVTEQLMANGHTSGTI